MKSFKTLEFVLLNILGSKIKLEARYPKYLFGTLNYGEVNDRWFNSADGDKWDVFVPGYSKKLAIGNYTVESVIGVFKLENHNHKIAVKLSDGPNDEDNSFCEIRCYTEIKRYTSLYTKGTKVNGEFIYLSSPSCLITDT